MKNLKYRFRKKDYINFYIVGISNRLKQKSTTGK